MEGGIDDFSDYLTSYSVRPYPTVGEDNASFGCAASSASSRPHVHVRFSHYTVIGWIDGGDGEEYDLETRTICLSNDVLAAESEDECCSFIFAEGLCYWPIDAETVLDIADEVIEKARRLKCNLQVDIRSVPPQGPDIQETSVLYEDDQDSGAAAPGVNAAAAYDGDLAVKSLKRKRIEYERDGEKCVVCLEELTAGTDVAVMPCNHYSFHGGCLSSWLERSPSCPLCRRKMPIVKQESVRGPVPTLGVIPILRQ